MEFSPAARSVSTRPLPKDCSTVNYGSDEKAPAWFSPSAGWRELRRCARSPGCHRPPDAVALRSAQRMGPARSDHQAVAAYAFGSFLASHQVAPPCLGEEDLQRIVSAVASELPTPLLGWRAGQIVAPPPRVEDAPVAASQCYRRDLPVCPFTPCAWRPRCACAHARDTSSRADRSRCPACLSSWLTMVKNRVVNSFALIPSSRNTSSSGAAA
jgi:hypothetical protein